ncbi:penicillin-binding protein activator [Sphingobium sufflavum]|nr:penicillin-binding protein activator [Sphingobium sufflavum]MCE7795903.1 penicillin-binding protein activator [Sphingobium sufflavum]
MMRQTMMRLAGLTAVAALAGCAVVPKPDRAPPPPPPTASGPDVIAPLPTDTQRHRVALLVPLSGTNAGVGRSIANATTMALFDTRTEQVRITTYDTAAAGGVAAATRRALAEGNRLILGPLTAEDVRAAAPLTRQAGVPMLSFSNDASVSAPGTYLMGYIPAQAVERVVGYARERGVTDFAALVPKGVYGERAGNAFLNAVRGKGGTVVALESFDRSPGAVAAAVKRLSAASSYDALLIADIGRVAVQVAPLVRAGGGAKARLLGTELWNTDQSILGNPAMKGAWFASVSDGLYRQFSTKYRARYQAAPYRLASLGYDAVLLTVRIAQDWKVGTPFPASRLNDREGFAGLDGAFRFGDTGVAERALEVSEVGTGAVGIVDAAPRGFGK